MCDVRKNPLLSLRDILPLNGEVVPFLKSSSLLKGSRLIVTLSLYRYESLGAKFWAFSRMGFARLMMPRISGLKFWKLMGTGAGDGFSTKPNFGVYTILCVWDDAQSARLAFASKQPFTGNTKRSAAHVHLTLSPTQARGDWAGDHPFGETVFDTPDGPISGQPCKVDT
jgi:spheroidene monooxygenase